MKIFYILMALILGLVQAATYGRYDENRNDIADKNHSQTECKHHSASVTNYGSDQDTGTDYTDSKDGYGTKVCNYPSNGKSDEAVKTMTPSSANQLPPPPLHEWKYGYNPPRVNPSYCTGFYIDYPKYPGLSFASDSIQEIKWRVNETELPVWKPDIIWRIRIINSTQHNEFVIGENMTLYSSENLTGSALFPLNVTSLPGLYHYRVMVNYVGQPVHCVYESVPFFVSHDPSKKLVYPGPPIWEGIERFYYSQDPKAGMTYHTDAVAAR